MIAKRSGAVSVLSSTPTTSKARPAASSSRPPTASFRVAAKSAPTTATPRSFARRKRPLFTGSSRNWRLGIGVAGSMPRTSSWVRVRNCEVVGLSGSITCACTAATPGTCAICSILAARSRPPAVKPVPIPMPSPATEIWPSTKRSPPSMKRVMRSAIAPSATRPDTPTAMPRIVKR